jgi:hypothetical protein
MRPVAFGEALSSGTRLTLFSDDKPDRFFTVIKSWTDETSGVAVALEGGVPTYQVEDEEGRTHLLIHLATEEEHEYRWCLGARIMQALIRGRFLGLRCAGQRIVRRGRCWSSRWGWRNTARREPEDQRQTDRILLPPSLSLSPKPVDAVLPE